VVDTDLYVVIIMCVLKQIDGVLLVHPEVRVTDTSCFTKLQFCLTTGFSRTVNSIFISSRNPNTKEALPLNTRHCTYVRTRNFCFFF